MFFKFLMKLPILKRIIPSILKRYVVFTGFYNKRIKLEGVILDLDLRYLIDKIVFLHRGYEDELYFNLVKIIKNNEIDYFLDIGSCWGIYSLRLTKKFKNLKILAFDPIKSNVNRIINSLKLNEFKNIKTFHTALGNKKSEIVLGASEDFSPNYQINQKNPSILEKSKIDLLDNLLSLKKNTLVVKIDVEGFEIEVLKGAKQLLLNNDCFLQIETFGDNKNEVFNFLNKINYQLVSTNTHNKADLFFSNFTFQKIEI